MGGQLPAGPSRSESIKGACLTNTLTLQAGRGEQRNGHFALPVLPVAASLSQCALKN